MTSSQELRSPVSELRSRKALHVLGAVTLVSGMLFSCDTGTDALFKEDVLFEEGLLFEDGFETSEGNQEYIRERYIQSGNKTMLPSSLVAREGNMAVVSHLDYYSSKVRKRTELVPRDLRGGVNFVFAKDYWIGLSIYVPDDYPFVEHDSIVWQFHSAPDEDDQESLNPPFALNVSNGKWNVRSRWDGSPLTERPYDGSRTWELAPVEAGWTDWVMRVRWSHEPGGEGILELWKNGSRVLDHYGPNTYNDRKGPYLKFGQYHWRWSKHSPEKRSDSIRTVYFDALRIGDRGYEQVAPKGVRPLAGDLHRARTGN